MLMKDFCSIQNFSGEQLNQDNNLSVTLPFMYAYVSLPVSGRY
jgi:hypothetical protein